MEGMDPMRAARTAALVAGLFLSLGASALAAEGTCDRCGCSCCPRRVCVPKIVEKEITKVCWDVKCEDICIPGPSKKCGTKCAHDECGCYTYDVWQPTCARVKTRRVPVKTEVKRKVPRIEWVVEYCCDACRHAGSTTPPVLPPETPETDNDPPPAPAPAPR